MDIFTALQTAVSGLKAQSYAIDNISGNIANSQTTGYKRIDTSFVDLLAEQTPKHEVAGTVLAQSQLTNSIQGNIASTTVATNMAVNGDGFFTVQSKTGDANGQSKFSGTSVYTRRGDFSPDRDGFLVNGAGGYLQGQNYDAATGEVTSTGSIQITNRALPAKATTTITYGANLPATPTTSNSPTTGSALYQPADTSVLVTTDNPTTPATQIAAGTASADFVANSISGPELTAYTANGAPVSLKTRWAKLSDATATTPAVWNLYYAADTTTSSAKSAWTNAGARFAFDSSGQLVQPSGGKATTTNLQVDGITLDSVSLAFDKTTLTQYAASSGAVTTNTLTQDGYASGTLNSVSVGTDGTIMGSFSNGSAVKLASVGVVRFVNPDGLKPLSNGTYAQTIDSGVPLTGLNGSTVIGASVESSNTDIASEFSKMIVTQQAYSANTKVMSTAQTMMSDLLNIIR